MIKQEFLKKNAEEKSISKTIKKILVAVSGGLDSMTLLQLLIDSQKELAIDLAIAHVNHKQRPESEQEEKALVKIAEELV